MVAVFGHHRLVVVLKRVQGLPQLVFQLGDHGHGEDGAPISVGELGRWGVDCGRRGDQGLQVRQSARCRSLFGHWEASEPAGALGGATPM